MNKTMKTREIYETLARLNATTQQMQDALIESEGEVTQEVEALEVEREDITHLLTDGIDALGDWLAAKEAEKARRKAELDHCRRKIAACDKTIEYIKGVIRVALDTMGEDKVKGEYYGFAKRLSKTTEVSKDGLNEMFKEAAVEALQRAGFPPFVTLTLSASSTTAKSEGLIADYPTIFTEVEKPTISFTKPRGGKNND